MRTCNAQELPRPLELATHVNDLQGRTIVNLVYRSDKLLLRLDNGAVAKLNMDPDEEAVELNPPGTDDLVDIGAFTREEIKRARELRLEAQARAELDKLAQRFGYNLTPKETI